MMTANDGARLIRKIEACDGIAAKLVLLRQFADKYAAAQVAEKEGEIADLRKKRDRLGEMVAEQGIAAHHATLRAEAAEQRLQEAQRERDDEREAHEKIATILLPLVDTRDGSSVSLAENASVEIVSLRERLRQREAELEQRWIAVGERLPEIVRHFGGKDNNMYGESEKIFIFNGEPNIGWLYKSGTWGSVDGNEIKQVTHWQPLPSPPKEAK